MLAYRLQACVCVCVIGRGVLGGWCGVQECAHAEARISPWAVSSTALDLIPLRQGL